MADDYTYSMADPEGSRESLDLTKQMLDVVREIKDIQASANSDKILQRDLTQEALEMAIEEAEIEASRAGVSKSEADIKRDILEAENLAVKLSLKKLELIDEGADREGDLVKGLEKEIELNKKKVEQGNEDLKVAKATEAQMGLMRSGLKAMSRIPILGEMFDASDVIKSMEDAGDGMFAKLRAGANTFGKQLWKNLGPAMFIQLGKGLLAFNKQTVETQRSLAISNTEAVKFSTNLEKARGKGTVPLLASTRNLLAANAELNKIRGTAIQFDNETLVTANELLKTKILTAEALGELSRTSNVFGGSLNENFLNQIDSVTAVEREHGVRLDMKSVLEAANKTTGQIRAQLGANPAALASAVAKAKALGMELEQVAATGKALLNFEQSIEAELQAELLTGRQLNLERARLAALTGDYVTLTEEINANVGDFGEFSKLNVLQQEALAQAHGMTADQMSDMLLKQADLGALEAQARAEGREDIAANMKKLSIQEKFNEAMIQLQDIFVNKIFPHIEPFINKLGEGKGIVETLNQIVNFGLAVGFIKVLSMVGKAIKFFKQMRKLAIGTAIANAWGAAMKNPTNAITFGASGLILGALLTAAIMGATAKADDLMAGPSTGYGNNMLVTKNKGTIMLNNKDSIVAGTNLLGGGKQEKFDYDKLAAAMQKTKIGVSIRNKPWDDGDVSAWGGSHQSSVRNDTSFA